MISFFVEVNGPERKHRSSAVCKGLLQLRYFANKEPTGLLVCSGESYPRGYNTFSMLNSAEHEIYILLINVKMPIIVGILTFISMINTTSERHRARNIFICRYFSVYEQLKFRA